MSEQELTDFRRQFGIQELTANEQATAEYARVDGRLPDPSAVREGVADQELVGAYLSIVERFPLSDVADLSYMELSWYYYRLEDYPNAIVTLNRLVEQYPNSEYADDALLLKSVLQERLGLYTESFETLQLILTAYPDGRITSSRFPIMPGEATYAYNKGNLTSDRAYERSRVLEEKYLGGPRD